MRRLAAVVCLMVAGVSMAGALDPPKGEITLADIRIIKAKIRAAYEAKGNDVEVLDVQMTKISPKELAGYVRFRFGLLPASNDVCTAIMDREGLSTSMKCSPETR